MTTRRDSQICLDATPYYHCYVRCVRQAFLCGDDYSNGKNYDHRRQWIVSRLRFLSYIYAIDICAYAVMSNHYHVVLHVNKDKAEAWSQTEVVERWLQLYKGNPLIDRWLMAPDTLDSGSQLRVDEIIEEWRERLYSVSWFMRGTNETIARMANEEDKCKGRFWESRFKSQALLDDVALLSCMAYVDLNPVRADMAEDLYASDFTSIQQRLHDYAKYKSNKSKQETKLRSRIESQYNLKQEMELDELPESPLKPFSGSAHTSIHAALPYTREAYFDLVDSTGRLVREDKKGFISSQVPALIHQLRIDPDAWIEHVKSFGNNYGVCVGSQENIMAFAGRSHRAWCKGVGKALEVYA